MKSADLLAGHFRKEGFLVLENIPGDGFADFPWVRANMVEHGTEVFGGTFGQIKVFFGLTWGWKEPAKFDGVVGQGSALANVAAFTAVLNIFESTPRLQLGEGGEATADGIKGFDGTAGAEIQFESFYSFAFGFFFCGEDGFSRIEGTVLDEVGEFFSFGPWRSGQSLSLADGESEENDKQEGGAHGVKLVGSFLSKKVGGVLGGVVGAVPKGGGGP